MLGRLAFILLVAPALATDFQKCDSGAAPPVKLDVEGCNSTPCVLRPREEVVVNVYFTSDHEVTKLTPEVLAEADGGAVSLELPDKDGCQYLLGSCCPVKANQTVRYHLHVDTPAVLHKNMTLVFIMHDQHDKDLACFKVNATS